MIDALMLYVWPFSVARTTVLPLRIGTSSWPDTRAWKVATVMLSTLQVALEAAQHRGDDRHQPEPAEEDADPAGATSSARR